MYVYTLQVHSFQFDFESFTGSGSGLCECESLHCLFRFTDYYTPVFTITVLYVKLTETPSVSEESCPIKHNMRGLLNNEQLQQVQGAGAACSLWLHGRLLSFDVFVTASRQQPASVRARGVVALADVRVYSAQQSHSSHARPDPEH